MRVITDFYFDDSDYWMMIESKGFNVVKKKDVVILHEHPASTLKHLVKEGQQDENKQIFISRWGVDSLKKVL
ncbi:MAG: hypothetical protein KatS3mg101_0970 [Patescibacteria group bacterium]|nr:MAG: hypothetical protein KatS3mg101_0970 [Patescibacteria group bacterium]